MAERVNWKHLAVAVVLAGGGGVGGAKILHGEAAQPPAAAAQQMTPDVLAGAMAKAFDAVLVTRDERVKPSTDSALQSVLIAIDALRGDVQGVRDEVRTNRAEATSSTNALRAEIQAQSKRIDEILVRPPVK